MNDKLPERKILIDEPSRHDLFHGKGHDRTAIALAEAIRAFSNQDRAIGLDGSWGSGKSSVVEIAEKKLSESSKNQTMKFHFFTYDIWKAQGSTFRRSFLEHLLDWSKCNFPNNLNQLEEIDKKVHGKVREIHTNNQSILDWYGVAVILSLPFLPIYYFWAKAEFDKLNQDESSISFLTSWPFLILVTFLIITLLKASWKTFKLTFLSKVSLKKLFSNFLLSLSSTLLITTKQYEDQKLTQHIREIDPNDFEFQKILREILKIVQTRNQRVVVILDNIDRLPQDEIGECWAQIRSVFSSTNSFESDSAITAIVPYDRRHIEGSTGYLDDNKGQGNKSKITSLRSREVFTKTFDLVLSISPPVMSNSRDFFDEKIQEALPNFLKKDNLFRVYLIFNRILDEEGGVATPRQIISFINELTGLYQLHDCKIRLTTIAVYLAYRDNIETDPSQLCSTNYIDEKLRTLADDNELERNLAAIIFNVEPDLAFQLLLDEKIKNASTYENAEKVIALSRSPGFDLRVHDVVQGNISEWASSNDLASVIENYHELFKEYKGQSKAHLKRTLTESLNQIDSLELIEEKYLPYLKLFDIGDDGQTPFIAGRLVDCAISLLNQEDSVDYDTGTAFVGFLNQVNEALASKSGNGDILLKKLNKISLPSNPDFILGVAYSIYQTEFELTNFDNPSIDFSEEYEDYLVKEALENPSIAIPAYSALKRASLVSDDQWVQVSNALLEALSESDEEKLEQLSDQLELVANTWSYTDRNKRSEITLSTAFESSQFYENIYNKFSEDESQPALASGLFLAGGAYLKDSLPTPRTRKPNGQFVRVETDGFKWFKGFFEGEKMLHVDQYTRIASSVRESLTMTHWLNFGSSVPDNKFIANVVEQAFIATNLPWITLGTLLERYMYLKDILDSKFASTARNFNFRLSKKEIQSVSLEECPIGFLTDTNFKDAENWRDFHKQIENLLHNIPQNEWENHLLQVSHIAQLLIEKISTSEFKFQTSDFRDTFVEFVLRLLEGNYDEAPHSINYDNLLIAIDANYHGEIYRNVRERVTNVTASSLETTSATFPDLIKNVIGSGDRVSKKEKDNIVRFLLCSALEGNNVPVLNAFCELGRTKVADFIRISEKETQTKKEGAWKDFSERSDDREFIRNVGELLHGKRKAKSWFDIIWGTGNKEEASE